MTCSEAHLVVAGANPSKKLRGLADGKIVHVLGKVDNIAPHLKDAALSIVPLRIGGGTRLKILESLAHKTPVVSTTIGAEGLELEHGKHILIADETRSFADSCIRLLEDPARRRQLAEAGYQRISNQYSWDIIESHVQDCVRAVLTQRN